MRTCVMELHGMDISTNKIPGVIKSVGDSVFHQDVDVPSRTTVQNICDEAHVLAKHHVSEVLVNTGNFDLFSDGTSRDGKKVMNAGVHTTHNTLVLGFKPVAREDSETVANILQNFITETADINESPVTILLSSLSGMMSDRSSVMKKTNVILDEWRTNQLKKDHTQSGIEKLNFFYCTAHVLLGFHNQILKDLKTVHKDLIGRDLMPRFARFKNSSEPPAVRLIRTASEVLGPRGDEKNGSVLADVVSNEVLSQVAALALVSIIIAEPFWSVANSNEHYLDLYKFICPLHDKLSEWSENADDLLQHGMPPLFPQFPHIVDLPPVIAAKLLVLPGISENLRCICGAMLQVVKRQLKDHLPSGVYSAAPDSKLRDRTKHTKLTNIPSENLFGDLDSGMRRKPNATLRHHSSVTMFKHNHTAAWLKKKSTTSRKLLLKLARNKAKTLKEKEQMYEKHVNLQRREMIEEIKRKKLKSKRIKQLEMKEIEHNVKNMGGIVRSRDEVDSIEDNKYNVKFMTRKNRNAITFVWPQIDDIQEVESKSAKFMSEYLIDCTDLLGSFTKQVAKFSSHWNDKWDKETKEGKLGEYGERFIQTHNSLIMEIASLFQSINDDILAPEGPLKRIEKYSRFLDIPRNYHSNMKKLDKAKSNLIDCPASEKIKLTADMKACNEMAISAECLYRDQLSSEEAKRSSILEKISFARVEIEEYEDRCLMFLSDCTLDFAKIMQHLQSDKRVKQAKRIKQIKTAVEVFNARNEVQAHDDVYFKAYKLLEYEEYVPSEEKMVEEEKEASPVDEQIQSVVENFQFPTEEKFQLEEKCEIPERIQRKNKPSSIKNKPKKETVIGTGGKNWESGIISMEVNLPGSYMEDFHSPMEPLMTCRSVVGSSSSSSTLELPEETIMSASLTCPVLPVRVHTSDSDSDTESEGEGDVVGDNYCLNSDVCVIRATKGKVLVVRDFKRSQKGELSLKTGRIVHQKEVSNSGMAYGWRHGGKLRVKKKSGFYPVECVAALVPTKPGRIHRGMHKISKRMKGLIRK
ncbi:hypothetical protein ScPMuIL_016652 [Solemya velum]